MPAWIGKPGSLVELQCPSTSDQKVTRPASTRTTLGGSTKGQLSPGRGRSWTVELGVASPSEAASVLDLVTWGAPPFVWIDPLAAAANMMSPAGGAMRPGTWHAIGTGDDVAQTGPKRLAENWAVTATSLTTVYGNTVTLQRVPVIPLTTYTGSVRVLSSDPYNRKSTLYGWWLDEYGERLASIKSEAVAWGVDHVRLSVTGRAPGRAAWFELEVHDAVSIAGPQVTATGFPVPWSPGLGSMSVMLTDIDTHVLQALTTSQAPRAVMSTYTFGIVDLE